MNETQATSPQSDRDGHEGPGAQQAASASKRLQRGLRDEANHLVTTAERAVRKPAVGASVVGAAVLAAGAAWGVTEAIVAAAAGYTVFRMLEKRRRQAREGAETHPAE